MKVYYNDHSKTRFSDEWQYHIKTKGEGRKINADTNRQMLADSSGHLLIDHKKLWTYLIQITNKLVDG